MPLLRVNPRAYVIFLKLRSSRHHMLPEDWQNKVRSVHGVAVLASSPQRLRVSAEDSTIQEVVRRVRAHCVIDLEGSAITVLKTGTLPLGILNITPDGLRNIAGPYAKVLARDVRGELDGLLKQYADVFDRCVRCLPMHAPNIRMRSLHRMPCRSSRVGASGIAVGR